MVTHTKDSVRELYARHEAVVTDKTAEAIARELNGQPLIPCKGTRDYWGEYDCGYEHAGNIPCDECLVNGGPMDPRTGKRSRKRKAKR